MPDLIIYSPDVTLLGPELVEKRPDYVCVVNGSVIFNVPKTPTKRIGNETISLVRVTDEQVALFDGLINCQVLGTREEVFADPVKPALYRKFYPGTSATVTFGGVEISAPPEEIPVFFQRD